MKKLIMVLALLSPMCFAAPYDILINQRNIADTATLPLIAPSPGVRNTGLVGFSSEGKVTTFKIGPSFMVYDGYINSASNWINVTDKPIFAPVATSGNYADLSNKPTIPDAQVSPDWNATDGPSKIFNKPSTLAGYGIVDAYPLSSNPMGFVSQIGARNSISLTTSGSSGAASYNASTGELNIPEYAMSNAVTGVTAGAGLAGGTITSQGTISMPNVGTPGTYQAVTTDAQGRVTGGRNMTINDTPGRSLVTSATALGYQVSASRVADVCYEGSFATTSTIGGPSAASVFLETSDTNSSTASDWTVKAQQTYSNTITLAVVVNQAQSNNWSFCRKIPAGKYVRIRSGNITGTASVTLNSQQQETLY